MSTYRTSLLSGLLLSSMASCALSQGHDFEVGQPVPDLILPTVENGSPRSLADFRGEKYILHVFASW